MFTFVIISLVPMSTLSCKLADVGEILDKNIIINRIFAKIVDIFNLQLLALTFVFLQPMFVISNTVPGSSCS